MSRFCEAEISELSKWIANPFIGDLKQHKLSGKNFFHDGWRSFAFHFGTWAAQGSPTRPSDLLRFFETEISELRNWIEKIFMDGLKLSKLSGKNEFYIDRIICSVSRIRTVTEIPLSELQMTL